MCPTSLPLWLPSSSAGPLRSHETLLVPVLLLVNAASTLVAARRLQVLVDLSKEAVITMLVLGASPPPASFRRHGCLPASMRRRASTPDWVGLPHAWPSLLALRLVQAPQRRQKTNGRGPPTLESTWPLAVHLSAPASPMSPLHVAAFCLLVRLPSTDQVPQMVQRHLPSSYLQKCCLFCLASCSVLAAVLLRRRSASLAGNIAKATPSALAINGARRI